MHRLQALRQRDEYPKTIFTGFREREILTRYTLSIPKNNESKTVYYMVRHFNRFLRKSVNFVYVINLGICV